VIMLAIGFGEQ